MGYVLDGTHYVDARDVVDAFGCSDYSEQDWREIAALTPDELMAENRVSFPMLTEADHEVLAEAVGVYARDRVALAELVHREEAE